MTREYEEYINSPRWWKKRRSAFSHYGRFCSRCGETEDLEVHHKTYERLGHELLDDLEVVCFMCHADADEERRAKSKEKGVNTYMKKKYGNAWWLRFTPHEAVHKFDAWLESKR